MNAVIRGDVHSIRIGAQSNVQDCAVLHGQIRSRDRRYRHVTGYGDIGPRHRRLELEVLIGGRGARQIDHSVHTDADRIIGDNLLAIDRLHDVEMVNTLKTITGRDSHRLSGVVAESEGGRSVREDHSIAVDIVMEEELFFTYSEFAQRMMGIAPI